MNPLNLQRKLVSQSWPVPSPRDLPNPGIEPGFPTLQADSLPSEPPGKPPKMEKEKKESKTFCKTALPNLSQGPNAIPVATVRGSTLIETAHPGQAP